MPMEEMPSIIGFWKKPNKTMQGNIIITPTAACTSLDEAGISYEKTTVGDKYVYECMTGGGHCVGGEQSGHIILSKYATTGDGILTAIKLTECMLEAKKTMSELAAPVIVYPQHLVNVRVDDKERVMQNAEILARVEEINRELGANGRLLLRKSGTEPVVRVMAEAETKAICEKYVGEVVNMIHTKGLSVQ